MSRATVRQITEFFRQMETGRITGEVLQEVIENAGKIHIKKLIGKYLQKARMILENTPESESFYNWALKETAIALAMVGEFDEARRTALKIKEPYFRAETFAKIGSLSIGPQNFIFTVARNDDFAIAHSAAYEEEGWRRVGTLLDVYVQEWESPADCRSLIEVLTSFASKLPDPIPNTNSEDTNCESLALAMYKAGLPDWNVMVKKSSREQEFLAHLVEYFVSHHIVDGWLDKAKETAEEISDIWAKADAWNSIVLTTRNPEDLEKLRAAMNQISSKHGGGFTHAKFAGTLAELGNIKEAVCITETLFPSARSEGYQHITEALVKKKQLDEAMVYAEKAGTEYGSRDYAFAAVSLGLARMGDFTRSRDTAEKIEMPTLRYETFAQIGNLSMDDKDFTKGYQVVQLFTKRNRVGKAEALARLVQIMATAIK